MSSSSGSTHYFAIQTESAAGTLPSPFTPTELRILPGSAFNSDQSALTSEELRSDRQITSSTLGVASPSWNPSVEWSYGSFDDLIAGALQSTWTGNGYATSLAVAVTATTIAIDSGDLWSSLGFSDGDVITITDLATSADNGSYLIASGSATDTITLTDLSSGVPTLTIAADAVITVVGGRSSIVIDASANEITVAATGNTITAASTIWTASSPDIKYNDLIYITGFVNAENNGYFKVASVTGTVLTFTSDSTLVNETLSTGDLNVANNTAIITTGTTTKHDSIESGYQDISQYRTLSGAQVSSMDLSFSTDSIVSGSFNFMGRSISAFGVTSEATSVVSSETTPVFNTYRGFISFDGSAPSCVTDFSLSLDNSSESLMCLFQDSLEDIVHGRSNVTGSFTAYFDDATLSNLYSAETSLDAFMTMKDADGNSISVGLPIVQLQGDTFDIAENTVSESLDFQALGGDATYTNIYFINSREIPA
jgi:hypothetical protein